MLISHITLYPDIQFWPGIFKCSRKNYNFQFLQLNTTTKRTLIRTLKGILDQYSKSVHYHITPTWYIHGKNYTSLSRTINSYNAPQFWIFATFIFILICKNISLLSQSFSRLLTKLFLFIEFMELLMKLENLQKVLYQLWGVNLTYITINVA